MQQAAQTAYVLPSRRSLGRAWVMLCVALALHVTDETLTNFLAVWNPTVAAIRARAPWMPLPMFRFEVWLTGLVLAVLLLLAVSPLVFRGARRMRPIAYILAVIMIGNGLGHIVGTIAGRTVATVHFPRPAPGFYSSPVLIAAAVWLLVQLRRTRVSA